LMGMFGILIVQALVSFAIIYYFATKAKDGMNIFKTVIAPILGGVGCLYVAYLLNDNKVDLAAGDPLFIKLVPWATVVFFAAGVILALIYRTSNPKKYEAIGR